MILEYSLIPLFDTGNKGNNDTSLLRIYGLRRVFLRVSLESATKRIALQPCSVYHLEDAFVKWST